uniref:glutathione transferase n=1 Tax=Chrysemys picta bellii TaxID=8478 RepID=A0A8C3EZ05_CHRPI
LSPGPDYDTSQWTNEKDKLGLDFPNLPYLIDGQTKLTQSNAILRYVARKHKMGEYCCKSKACLHGELDWNSSSGIGPQSRVKVLGH